MKARYFTDTDTMLLEFSNSPVTETYDLNENVVVEVDQSGRVVSLTIEHAADQMDVREFSYQQAS
jgi:uncharacterized protein YuzE